MALRFEDIAEEFKTAVNSDKQVQKYLRQIYDGSTSYETANKLSIRVGEKLGQVLKKYEPIDSIDEWDYIDLIPKSLGLDHQIVADACRGVQENINKDAGLGIKYYEPKFNMDRVNGLITELQTHDFQDIKKSFYDQLVNFSENVVDDSIRDNAGILFRAGVRTMVIRQAEYNGCEWCQAVAGAYDYAEVSDSGNDVWRRHDNCKCVIDFKTERSTGFYSERVLNYKEKERNKKGA